MLEDISLDSMYLYNFYYYGTDTAHYNTKFNINVRRYQPRLNVFVQLLLL